MTNGVNNAYRPAIIRAVIGAIFFSCVGNLLALAAPIFMIEVYDRVLPSKSGPTLATLLLLVVGLYIFAGFLETVKGRIMTRVAIVADGTLTPRVFAAIARMPLKRKGTGDILKPAQDLEQIRAFCGSNGPTALFDLPWMPIYAGICFFIHPLLGSIAAAAMLVLVGLTLLTDLSSRRLTKRAATVLTSRNRYGEAASRNAEVIAAMGMEDFANQKWSDAHSEYIALQRRISDIAGGFSACSKTIRITIQSGTLALGAWLVIKGELTGGMILASNVLVGRALAPAEQIIANWRNITAARQAWQRLKELLSLFPEEAQKLELPAPSYTLQVEDLFIAPPGEQRITVKNIRFQLEAGAVLGIIGPSGSGKSSLVRTLAGVWKAQRGEVRLDGAVLDQWPSAVRGRHIGYLPQSFDLFPGSIAENIARLDPHANDDAIIAAGKAAGAHDMIVSFKDGYETQVGEAGTNLSAGQRQRVALARALYGDPFLVVLDEPNSNLDAEGDKALVDAVAGIKARDGIVIIVAHRNNVLPVIDTLLIMEDGTAKAFGPRDTVLRSMAQQKRQAVRALEPELRASSL